MATIKSYSDLQQSKVLSKILSGESADMSYKHFVSDLLPEEYCISVDKVEYETDIPCWSLAALLNVVSEVSLNSFKDGDWNAMVKRNDKMIYSDKDNPIDACYEMILKLHELKML